MPYRAEKIVRAVWRDKKSYKSFTSLLFPFSSVLRNHIAEHLANKIYLDFCDHREQGAHHLPRRARMLICAEYCRHCRLLHPPALLVSSLPLCSQISTKIANTQVKLAQMQKKQ